MEHRDTCPYDVHHLLWPRRNWNKGVAKMLRRHWYLKVIIPRAPLHDEIHIRIQEIPVPEIISIENALTQLDILERYGALHDNDSIEKRLHILMSLFECCEPKLYKALKDQHDIACRYPNGSR